jgi:S-layer family protein
VVYVPDAGTATTFDIGYGVVCSDPFSYVYRDTGDVDGDGFEEHVAHQIEVDFNPGPGLMFGGVRIFWHRQMSPAPAAASFADVPVSHPYFRAIEALATSGITGGCGSGNFCPSQNVTRGEMAAFFARALGLHWAD